MHLWVPELSFCQAGARKKKGEDSCLNGTPSSEDFLSHRGFPVVTRVVNLYEVMVIHDDCIMKNASPHSL